MRNDDQMAGLEAVFVSQRKQLFRAALGIVKQEETAEDVVQDAFVKVMEFGGKFSIDNPGAYVRQVVNTLAIDRFRRHRLESGIFAREGEGIEGITPLNPERVAISHEELERVSAAIGAMPMRERCAFELHRHKGYSQRGVAEQLDISPSMVNLMVKNVLKRCSMARTSME